MDDGLAGEAAEPVFFQFFFQTFFPVLSMIIFPYRTGHHIVRPEYGDDIREDPGNGSDAVDGFRTVSAEAEYMAQVVASHPDVEDPFLHGVENLLQLIEKFPSGPEIDDPSVFQNRHGIDGIPADLIGEKDRLPVGVRIFRGKFWKYESGYKILMLPEETHQLQDLFRPPDADEDLRKEEWPV